MEILDSSSSSYQWKLSLEPALPGSMGGTSQRLEEMPPAFFGRPTEEKSDHNTSTETNDFDPGMADIQVAVETLSASLAPDDMHDDEASVLKGRVLFVGGNANVNGDSSSATQTPSSSHKKSTPQVLSFQQQQQQLPDAWPLILYFRIDKENVFQVDGNDILHVELIPPAPDDDHGSNKSRPPSLALVFPYCIFRIFPMPSDNTTPKKAWHKEGLTALQKLETQCLQLSDSTIVPSPAYWSPCGSSSLPSSIREDGQKNSEGWQQQQSHSTLTASSSSTRRPHKKLKATTTTHDDDTDPFQNHPLIQKVQHRQQGLALSWVGMHQVEKLLDMPMLAFLPDPTKGSNHLESSQTMTDWAAVSQAKTQGHHQVEAQNSSSRGPDLNMGPLLTGIAEDLTAAYGTATETEQVFQLYQAEIEEQPGDPLDLVLDSFFPVPPKRLSSSRKQRQPSSKSTRGGEESSNRKVGSGGGKKNAPAAMKSVEETMEALQGLMDKQSKLVEERCSLYDLPTRG